MALPKGILNLQHVVRDLEQRIVDLEAKLTGQEPASEPKTQSEPEPPATD